MRVICFVALLLACVLPARVHAQTTASQELLHLFNGTEGLAPTGLVQGSDGSFYGTCEYGGPAYPSGLGYGSVFQLSPNNTVTDLGNFNFSNGYLPFDVAIQAQNGLFYGTTGFGGITTGSYPNGCGVVFSFGPSGGLTDLYQFTGGTDGAMPMSRVIQYADGYLYGTTSSGGVNGHGTIFRITTGGALETLHSFNGTDGATPYTSPIRASDGNFYGTTFEGGTSNKGTVYRLTPDHVLTPLHHFDGSDGARPSGILIQATDGNLYGVTTDSGGPSNAGTIFRMTLAGQLTALHTFNGADGTHPLSIIQARDGNFYGITYVGGTNNWGTFFQLTPGGVLTDLYNWTDGTDGGNPGPVIQGGDDNFYGATFNTDQSRGTVYRFLVHPHGALQFTAAGYNVSENAGTAFIPVARAYHHAGAVTIQYTTADGSAKAGMDYQSTSGTLSWTDGDQSDKNILVPITDRGLFDGSTRTLSLVLSSPGGGADLGNPATATLTIHEDDPPPPAPAIKTNALPDGQVGVSYSFQVTATNSPTSFAASGLPRGLAIDTDGGLISGTPTAAGTFSVKLSATNAGGTGSKNFSLTILPALPVVTSPGSASGQVGQPFSYRITATNGPTSFGVLGLTDGLTVDGSTGKITGTPTAAKSFNLTLNATNGGGTGSATLTVNITAAPPPAVPQLTSAASDTAQVGQAYEYTITATNNPTQFASNPSPPCPGLTLDPATGVISGTPTQAGKFTPSLTATNANGAGPAASFTLNISPAPEDIYGFNFASPPSQSRLVSGNTVPVYVQVLYSPGTLASVKLFADDITTGASTEIGESDTSINQFNWQPTAATMADAYTLRAVATDTAGVAKTFTLPVTVVPPPSENPVSSIQLLPNVSGRQFIPGSTVTLVPVAGKADTEIKTVGVYDANGTAIARATQPLFTSVTSRVFPPINYPVRPGVVTLTATVTNENNCSNPSVAAYLNPASVQVDLTTLTCEIATPATNADGAATVVAGKALTVTTTAKRKNGSNASMVEYYVDGGLVGSSTNAPSFGVTVPASKLAAGKHTLTAIATDANLSVSRQADPVALTAKSLPVITSAGAASATQGKTFSYQIAATNNPTNFGVLGLPPGLQVDGKSGLVSGTPTVSGVKTLTLKATNAEGTGTKVLTLTIQGPPVITSAKTASATVGKTFSYQITATNDPTSYGVLGLPPGLKVDSQTGIISGTPTKAGTFTLTLNAANSVGKGSATLTLTTH